MQFYGISFTRPYKQSGRWQDVFDAHAYTNTWKKYHRTACTSFPEDERLDIRNMSKTLQLNSNIHVKSLYFIGSCYTVVM